MKVFITILVLVITSSKKKQMNYEIVETQALSAVKSEITCEIFDKNPEIKESDLNELNNIKSGFSAFRELGIVKTKPLYTSLYAVQEASNDTSLMHMIDSLFQALLACEKYQVFVKRNAKVYPGSIFSDIRDILENNRYHKEGISRKYENLVFNRLIDEFFQINDLNSPLSIFNRICIKIDESIIRKTHILNTPYETQFLPNNTTLENEPQIAGKSFYFPVNPMYGGPLTSQLDELLNKTEIKLVKKIIRGRKGVYCLEIVSEKLPRLFVLHIKRNDNPAMIWFDLQTPLKIIFAFRCEDKEWILKALVLHSKIEENQYSTIFFAGNKWIQYDRGKSSIVLNIEDFWENNTNAHLAFYECIDYEDSDNEDKKSEL